jgi:hypothetical protein
MPASALLFEKMINLRRPLMKATFLRLFASAACVFGLLLSCSPRSPAQTNTFTNTGSMSSTRNLDTSTTLQNGMVLIAGGYQRSTAELYNPVSGTSSVVGSMHSPRWGHTATLLTNGTVLVTGGCTGSGTCLSSAELYNPSTGAFAVTGSMSTQRNYHTATLLQNGIVLIAGGCNGGNGCDLSAELYDPSTGIFTLTGSMSTRRYSHTASLLNNGTVLVTGGCTGGGTCLSSAELYSPISGTFTVTGSMHSPRYEHTAAIVNNGDALIAGGCNGSNGCFSTAELFNPATGSFALTGSMSTKRYFHTATLMQDGTVLEAGGCTGGGTCLSSAEFYNPATAAFTSTSSMNVPRYQQTAALLNDGTVLVSGGCNGGNGCFSTQQLFHPETGTAGFVNPRYIILGVTYAPPGPQSSVQYSTSTFVGSTTNLSSSFQSQFAQSVSISAGISAWGVSSDGKTVGKITGTTSTTYTQQSGTSTAVTISKETSEADNTTGTAYAFSPVNHDYDQVWLWLNPLVIFTFYPSNVITWNGYGYDPKDPTMQPDVYPVAVGYLNGHFGPMPQSMITELSRAWATNQTWPAGQGPALTSTDYTAILAADPFSNSSYSLVFAVGVSPATTTDGRFTIANTTSSFPYVQCDPGGGACNSETYKTTYTNSTALGQGSNYKFEQMFGLQAEFGGTAFGSDITTTVTRSSTLTWMSSFQTTITHTTTQMDSATIQGPPCTGNPCNPLYAGPAEFVLYQDNLFGTFLFNGVN